MKKLFLMVAFMAATVAASAQVYIGGGINFSSYKPAYIESPGSPSPDSQTKFGIAPEIGYKLDDKMAVGISLGYSHSSKKPYTVNEFSIAPYFRYTFVKWNNVGLFADAEFAYNFKKTTEENGTYDANGNPTDLDTKENGWSLGIRPGVSIDVNDKLTFVTKVGFLGYKSEKPSDVQGQKGSSEFGLDFDTKGLEFALYYNF